MYTSTVGALPAVIALVVFAMFLPTIVVPYAFSDDYPILSAATGLKASPWFSESVLDVYALSGRPFAGLFSAWAFSAAGTIDNLRFVRLVAVIGIVGVCLLLHWALVRAGVKSTPAALVAVLVCSMPAFQVFASWAVAFTAPYAALLGGAASLLTTATLNASRNLRADRLMGGIALLLTALLIYQPAAMFFWLFLAVALVGAVDEPTRALRLVRAHFGVGAVSLALAFLVLKIAAGVIDDTGPNAGRTAITHDVPGKARWFFELPLHRALNLFDLTPSSWLAAIVATIAAGGMVLWLVRHSTRPLMYAVTAVILIPLSFLPNLVVGENSPTYRVQVSLSSLIALYACLGIIGIWFTVRDWLRPRVRDQTLRTTQTLALTVAVALVGGSAFTAAKNVTTLFVEPQSTELRMIRSQVAALPAGVARVAFVQIGYHQGMAKIVTVDEFGVPSSARPWTPEPSVLLVLREEGRLPQSAFLPVIDVYPWYTTTFPANEPVVDLRGLERLR